MLPSASTRPFRLAWPALLCAALSLLEPNVVAAAEVIAISRSTTPPATAHGASTDVIWARNGRYAVVVSTADDLVPGQVSLVGERHIFLFDRSTSQIQLIDHALGSVSTAADSQAGPDVGISPTGEWVTFTSSASNLVADQVAIFTENVFLWRRSTNDSILVSHAAGSSVTPANSQSSQPSLSADGRFVAFQSAATNLPGVASDTNQRKDVFRFDRLGTTVLVSHSSDTSGTIPANEESGAPSISADGRFVAFQTLGTNLVAGTSEGIAGLNDVYLWDSEADAAFSLVLLSRQADHATTGNDESSSPVIADDGSAVVYLSKATNLDGVSLDQNGSALDIFRYEVATDALQVVSHRRAQPTQTGNAGTGDTVAISGYGTEIAFSSQATDYFFGQEDTPGTSDVFLWHGPIQLVSHAAGTSDAVADGASKSPLISFAGNRVLFASVADDLIEDQITSDNFANVFLWDRDRGITELISRTLADASTTVPLGGSRSSLSEDGSYVGFFAFGNGLVENDTNGNPDAFYAISDFPFFRDGFESGDVSAWTSSVP